MNNFLPEKYEVPGGTGGYMKFQQGDNKFRILDSAIVGYEMWVDTNEGRKPRRYRMDETIPQGDVGNDMPKHFWAFPVYNYTTKSIQILEITQKTIQRTIRSLTKSEDWGDPKGYDVTVSRAGEGMDTEYTVQPSPPKEVDPGIVQLYKDMHINLEALFDGEDPYESKDEVSVDEIPVDL